jgi:TonB family protein
MNELSVAADGSVADARTLVAYPAFVFGEAALRIGRRTRFDPIYMDDGGVCVAGRQTVRFVIP